MRRAVLLQAAMSLLFVADFACAPASAEVQLSGTKDYLTVRAKNASLAEILASFGSALNLSVGLSGSTTRHFTGTYAGPLQRVLSRLLEGEDYVIRSAPYGLSIAILGAKGIARGPALAVQSPSTASDRQIKVAAGDDEQTVPVQGWTNSASFAPRSAPPGKKSGAEAPNGEPQTLVGKSVAAEFSKPQADETEQASGVQGWTAGNSWVTGNRTPAKAVSRAADAAPDPPAAAEDEGNPKFQGYMPDWTPPADIKGTPLPMPLGDVPSGIGALNVRGLSPSSSSASRTGLDELQSAPTEDNTEITGARQYQKSPTQQDR